MTRLWAERLLDTLTPEERARAERVESVLPALAAAAAQADLTATFPASHVRLLADAGLMGLVVPTDHGGLGGGLRDLAAACFAMGSQCASTALAYFFHCSSASRGLLPLEAIEAGLFTDEEVPVVRAFAERVLELMGRDGRWLANFASESVKTAGAAITIATEATPVEGGWRINGTKSFGCATGVADNYLVTARLAGHETADGLALFIVGRDAAGVSERQAWDGIGMRATANHGIVLKDVFVAADDALAVPGAFVRMMQVSRGSFVGNQLAVTAVYVGIAQRLFDLALEQTSKARFADTGAAIASSPMHQVLFGEMSMHMEQAYLWLRRQLELETSEPELRPKADVVRQWRIAKGSVCEESFAVGVLALKACGTSGTANSGVLARGLRDLTMGLVQAFPAERGRLESAHILVSAQETTQFAGMTAPGPGGA